MKILDFIPSHRSEFGELCAIVEHCAISGDSSMLCRLDNWFYPDIYGLDFSKIVINTGLRYTGNELTDETRKRMRRMKYIKSKAFERRHCRGEYTEYPKPDDLDREIDEWENTKRGGLNGCPPWFKP